MHLQTQGAVEVALEEVVVALHQAVQVVQAL
jgi:hypothetical protein